ncbi:hypothetical protein GCM10010343_13710 [Streptomyces avidinii]|uniref:Uncharacterized protein n=1 Tax=Streptomyces avidinii TaxID=1895 RepID=A0ABS4KXY0_STRAV|nr:hypothetical protein [Streptomyces avidinii]GGY89697.1 hypothetical protein GCM10010343_13710 [Streptomyces avidinii]
MTEAAFDGAYLRPYTSNPERTEALAHFLPGSMTLWQERGDRVVRRG